MGLSTSATYSIGVRAGKRYKVPSDVDPGGVLVSVMMSVMWFLAFSLLVGYVVMRVRMGISGLEGRPSSPSPALTGPLLSLTRKSLSSSHRLMVCYVHGGYGTAG